MQFLTTIATQQHLQDRRVRICYTAVFPMVFDPMPKSEAGSVSSWVDTDNGAKLAQAEKEIAALKAQLEKMKVDSDASEEHTSSSNKMSKRARSKAKKAQA